MPLRLFHFLLGLLLLVGCSPSHNHTPTAMPEPLFNFSAGPPTVVYKTRHDYSQLVPVTLSEDRKEIVAYPHPADVLRGGQPAYPTPLLNGYLLDNRGITPQVAFLRITYAEYARLPQAPSLAQLHAMILDPNPLLEICHCGNRNQYRDLVQELNALIAENLKFCRPLK